MNNIDINYLICKKFNMCSIQTLTFWIAFSKLYLIFIFWKPDFIFVTVVRIIRFKIEWPTIKMWQKQFNNCLWCVILMQFLKCIEICATWNMCLGFFRFGVNELISIGISEMCVTMQRIKKRSIDANLCTLQMIIRNKSINNSTETLPTSVLCSIYSIECDWWINKKKLLLLNIKFIKNISSSQFLIMN